MTQVLDIFAATDVGLKRDHNEDHFLVSEKLGLYVVADGMGGHAAGEVASRTAVNTIEDFLGVAQTDRDFTWPFGVDRSLTEEENLLVTAIKLANREICLLAEERPEYHGMGTTIATLKVSETHGLIAHVGDSRAYRLRNGALDQITADHSWVNEQVARSVITEEEARTHRWRNVITRALGNRDAIEVDLAKTDVLAGDAFLLCTDGLSGMVPNEGIHRVLGKAVTTPSKRLVRELIALANDAGGIDNITVVVLRVLSPGPGGPKTRKRTRATENADDETTLTL